MALFVMHSTRQIMPIGGSHLEQQVIAIEQSVQENPGLTFDLAKTLIESACKTILNDHSHICDSSWDLPRLLKETLGVTKLTPESCDNHEAVENSLKKTAGGLQMAIHGICELRNTFGFASHGKDAYTNQLEMVQAEFVARAADTITSFLFRTHYQYHRTPSRRNISYQDNPEFNDYVDATNDQVRIFESVYKPSEVLYMTDIEAYRDYLANYQDSA